MVSTYLGWSYGLEGRHDAALAEARRGLELEPEGLPQIGILGNCYLWAGRFDDALKTARRLIAATDDPRRLGMGAVVLPRAGQRGEAEAIRRPLEALPPGTWGREAGLSAVYLGLGDTTRALDAMERAAAGDGDLFLGYLPSVFDLLRPFRNNARFAAVMRRYNLDPDVMTSFGGAPRK